MHDQERADLESQVLAILQALPAGVSEYELIRRLADDGHAGFQGKPLGDSACLFRMHFALFHVLYRLQERLGRERRGTLHISPLRIALHGYSQAQADNGDLCSHDPLRDYYLNLDHLDNTSAADVDALLHSFWSRMSDGGQRKDALRALGLNDPVDNDTIKHRYRRLVMRLHPDRGGDAQRLRDVNAAMSVLMQGRKRA